MGKLAYQESIFDYFGRKHFLFVVPAAALAVVVIANLAYFWGSLPPIHVLAIDAVITGGIVLIFRMQLPMLRFRRFRIYEHGFTLPGVKASRGERWFLPFDLLESVEGVAWVRKGAMYLERITISSRNDRPIGGPRRETSLSTEELSRRNIIRLWDEFVSRGLATRESLEILDRAR